MEKMRDRKCRREMGKGRGERKCTLQWGLGVKRKGTRTVRKRRERREELRGLDEGRCTYAELSFKEDRRIRREDKEEEWRERRVVCNVLGKENEQEEEDGMRKMTVSWRAVRREGEKIEGRVIMKAIR